MDACHFWTAQPVNSSQKNFSWDKKVNPWRLSQVAGISLMVLILMSLQKLTSKNGMIIVILDMWVHYKFTVYLIRFLHPHCCNHIQEANMNPWRFGLIPLRSIADVTASIPVDRNCLGEQVVLQCSPYTRGQREKLWPTAIQKAHFYTESLASWLGWPLLMKVLLVLVSKIISRITSTKIIFFRNPKVESNQLEVFFQHRKKPSTFRYQKKNHLPYIVSME